MSERERLRELDALVRDGQLDRAAEMGKEISGQFPDSFQVQFTYAGVLRRLDELDRAREILVELQRKYPENINLLLALAEIHRRGGNTAAAAEHYNKVLFFDPFNQAAKDALAALGVTAAPAAPPPRPAAPKEPRPRIEVDPDRGEPGSDFTIDLEEVHLDNAPPDNVQPDDSPTLDLDEAGIPKPQLEEKDPDSILPEFGMPLEAPDEPEPVARTFEPEVAPFPASKEPAPEPVVNVEEGKDVLRVPWEEVPPPPQPDLTDTSPLKIERPPAEERDETPDIAEEPAAAEVPELEIQAEPEKARQEEAGDDGVEFYTESAAGLYAAQGLWSEAAEIYRELHRRSGDDRYLEQIKSMERRRLNLAKIRRLKQLLADMGPRDDGGPGV